MLCSSLRCIIPIKAQMLDNSRLNVTRVSDKSFNINQGMTSPMNKSCFAQFFIYFFVKAPPTARFITAATSQHSSVELWNRSSIYNPISLCTRVGLILKRHEVTSNKSHSHTAFRLLIWLLPCPRNWRSRPAAAWPSPCPCLASGTAQHRQMEQSKEKKGWLPLWHVYHHQRHYLGNINPASARGMSSHGVSRRW